ncbi:FecR family protein [Pedobacter sp. ASV1-7]|uniref:FecR family protein n=1 Tax=Pedobacter sp. ASV1-7 TaxID=3145237 RepID=UPI0032E89D1E
MNKEKLQLLLKAYLDHTISEEDCLELMDLTKDIDQKEMDEMIDRELQGINSGPSFRGAEADAVLNLIKKDPKFNSVHLPIYKRIFYNSFFRVAAILVPAVFAILYIILSEKEDTTANVKSNQIVINPGNNKAVLTLANGKQISLSDAQTGELANEGNVSIRKISAGQLVYNRSDLPAVDKKEASYNTIKTPNGGEYHIVLPDGTRVWLNSASSLTFPTKFSKKNREVSLKGEAYFEVAHDKKVPFHVQAKGSVVEVLGTHFNISAYEDDAEVATTLLEGSVKVSKNKHKSLLVPGQQSLIMDGVDGIVVKKVNTEDVIAWHNGFFKFQDEDIKSVLKKVSRWYDVEVEYRNTKKSPKLGGLSYRTKSLNDLLAQLEKIGNLHYKLEGRRIIVVD